MAIPSTEEPPGISWRRTVVLMAGVTLATYWPIVTYPFLQEDWRHLYQLRTDGAWSYLRFEGVPWGRLLYRPLGALYFSLVYWLGGLDPVPFHVVALALQTLNACLVSLIAAHLFGSRALGAASGVVYGTTAAVHIEPLLWMVGFYDLAGQACVLLAIHFCLRGRMALSAATTLAGLLVKESTIFVLPLLVVHHAIYRPPRPIASLRWHVPVAVGYLALKMGGASPTNLPAAYPHKVTLALWVVRDNVPLYGGWLVDALWPLGGRPGDLATSLARWLLQRWRWSFEAMIVLSGLAAIWWLRAWRPAPRTRFLAAWALLSMGPALFLANHQYQYYLVCTLPPVVLLIVDAMTAFLGRPAVRLVAAWACVSFVVGVAAVVGWHLRGEIGLPGMSGLVAKGQAVKQLIGDLRASRTAIPRGATLVFEGIDVWAFSRDHGPRLWYGDTALVVYDAKRVRCEGGRLSAIGMPRSQTEIYSKEAEGRREVLDPERIALVRYGKEGTMVLAGQDAMSRLCRGPG